MPRASIGSRTASCRCGSTLLPASCSPILPPRDHRSPSISATCRSASPRTGSTACAGPGTSFSSRAATGSSFSKTPWRPTTPAWSTRTPSAPSNRAPFPVTGDWLCIQVISGRSIATLPGAEPPFPPLPDLDEDARQGTYFTVILPDLPVRRGSGIPCGGSTSRRSRMIAPASRSAAASPRRFSPTPASPPRPRPITTAGKRSAARMSASSRSSSRRCSRCFIAPVPCPGATTWCRRWVYGSLDRLDLV